MLSDLWKRLVKHRQTVVQEMTVGQSQQQMTLLVVLYVFDGMFLVLLWRLGCAQLQSRTLWCTGAILARSLSWWRKWAWQQDLNPGLTGETPVPYQ